MIGEARYLERFCRDGYVRLEGVFFGEELESLRAAASTVIEEAGRAPNRRDSLASFLRRLNSEAAESCTAEIESVYWRTKELWEHAAPVGGAFAAAIVHPRVLASIAACVGRPFLPINDYLITKMPQSGFPIFWHQDPPYNDPRVTTTAAVPSLDVSVYLDDATIDNGCLWVLPGYHLVGHVTYEARTQHEMFAHQDAVPVEMKAGDVLLHSLSTPHGSAGNHSDRARRVYYVHYATEDFWHRALATGASASKLGFTTAGKAAVRRMIRTRRLRGLSEPFAAGVSLDDEGFRARRVHAAGQSPWVRRMKSLSLDEIARKQRLDESRPGAPGVGP